MTLLPPLALLGQLTGLQLATLAGYFTLLLSIAFAFRRMNRNGDDYFRSGSQGSWWLVGMSTYMASFSAYTFTGLAGAAYVAGYSASTNFIANVIGFGLNGLCLAAWLRQLRVTTAPESLIFPAGRNPAEYRVRISFSLTAEELDRNRRRGPR
jgi:Na+(H+)/acetate symporter ActP